MEQNLVNNPTKTLKQQPSNIRYQRNTDFETLRNPTRTICYTRNKGFPPPTIHAFSTPNSINRGEVQADSKQPIEANNRKINLPEEEKWWTEVHKQSFVNCNLNNFNICLHCYFKGLVRRDNQGSRYIYEL